MSPFSHVLFRWLLVVMVVGSYGCGTIRTMPTLASYDAPKIYSGTRLDFYAATGNEASLTPFSAKPPEYPLIDIPFSFILDTIILPVTISVAGYKLVFGL